MRVKPAIMDRYLLREFLKPFLFSVFTITVIMISEQLFRLTDLIIVKQVPFPRVLKLLVYRIPQVMVESFGISILFATLLSLSQLVKNNEFTAFRMGGISLHRLLIPFLVLALLISGVTFLINEQVVPWATHRSQNIVRRIILQQAIPDLQAGSFFQGVTEERHFYVEDIIDQTGELKNIMVFELDEDSNYPRLITAQAGYFEDKVWHLVSGVVHKFNDQGQVVYQSNFEELTLDVKENLDNFYGEQRTTSEMSRAELKENIKLFKDSGLDVNSLLVDYHLKLARPLACFIFVLIGAPLSLKSNQGRVFGIIASIVIIFLYYVVMSLCRSLGRNDLLAPLLAAWIPNILFGIVGAYLLIKEEYFNLG
jgi:lipopolysaccharide export system permease protein